MSNLHETFLEPSFLRSAWAKDYEDFRNSDDETALISRLKLWAKRKDLKETSAEQAFIQQFFHHTWRYYATGTQDHESTQGFSSWPQFPVPGAGEAGSAGSSDLALGWFERDGVPRTAQVLCEFKGIKANLDAPQKRKSNTRSPVKQCIDYIAGARKGLFGNESVLPTWGIVTDMNEFRLYWFDRAPHQYMRFVLTPDDPLFTRSLLDDSEEGRFDRFLFWKLFHADTLLTTGGKSPLEKLIARQWVKEREIENAFYKEYRTFRDRLYRVLVDTNPAFAGTKGQLVKLAQKILDRCIFLCFAEDMGAALQFPHQLLRDMLIHHSKDEYYDANGTDIWDRLKRLFTTMNNGGPFPPSHQIKRFNGGLFEDDPTLENLVIPNKVFCEKNQGHGPANLSSRPDTLLYLSASYNYAVRGDAEKSIGLYTLGRIFEQSITELEILEAEAEGRESLNKISKRKRDGVYYTPERIVQKIVDETLGLRLSELKLESNWKDDYAPSRKAAERYWTKLKAIKVLDPACGSGAFLITCLQTLLTESRIALDQVRRFDKKLPTVDDSNLIKSILANNLFGVDINPASVEIAKLALWLHTARPGEPLTTLDDHIRDGNSLIDSTFYVTQDLLEYADEERERINAFDWDKEFPNTMKHGGFDVIVSNPPYVKLQNFRKIHPDMAEYLRQGRQGKSYYESTQTGNFDLYLPFVEKGLSLLNEGGRMGFIAPNLWLVNDYGLGLRRLLKHTRQLDRWVDFGSHQIFEEASIYTALQFYSKKSNKAVCISPALDGDVTTLNWEDDDNSVPYQELSSEESWILLSKEERTLIKRLEKTCKRLDSKSITKNIFVGIQTSADSIYHLKRLDKNHYLCSPQGKNNSPYQVEIEDTLMKPLVSGPVAKRYTEPDTYTYILFPYEVTTRGTSLIQQDRFSNQFPKAWRYLQTYEDKLRKREATLDKKGDFKLDKKGHPLKAPFNDNHWYRFGRHQSLDKQEIEKLLVPRLVSSLKASVDEKGIYYIDNVDVGGIQAASGISPYYLAAFLNGPVASWVFRRISKPFRGDYRSANRQFIAPLPIPDCDKKTSRRIAEQAKALQTGYSKLRDRKAELSKRLGSVKPKSKPEHWLFPDIGTLDDMKENAPQSLDTVAQNEWTKDQYKLALEERYEAIQKSFRTDTLLKPEYNQGELRFLVAGSEIIRLYVEENEGPFLQAQWQQVADTFSISENTRAKKLCDLLRKIIETDNAALKDQVIKLQSGISLLEAELWSKEKAMNELLYKAYELTDEERKLVEAG
ncbi:MAG: Eco57I restriction-modification methylase domain-containing protein [Rhodospirillaceae bacterium]